MKVKTVVIIILNENIHGTLKINESSRCSDNKIKRRNPEDKENKNHNKK
ncbi:MAG: hypothetical protein ACTSWY_04045 [Promethearchaeota archaeon]